MLEQDHAREKIFSQKALQWIDKLQLSPDPVSYELWYTYCAGYNSALNNAVNELLEAIDKPSAKDMESLYRQHLPSIRLAEDIRSIGENLHDRTSDLANALEEASGSVGGYSEQLADAARQLRRIEEGEALSVMVTALLRSTEALQKTNGVLQEQLSISADQMHELQQRLEKVQLESMIDPLTGVANRRLFELSLERTISSAHKDGKPVSLLLTDIDKFKMFNDRYGHQVGDDVLRLVSAAIKQNSRGADQVCRYGGDEFAIILPETPIQGAVILAEKIRTGVMERELVRRSTKEQLGRVTVSIGVSQYQNGDSIDSLIARADHWLYAAKQQGRNRVGLEDSESIERSKRTAVPTSIQLVWEKAYECGDPTIDSQHQRLFELANLLFDPELGKASAPQLPQTALDKLLAHVVQHFADEETVLEAHGYASLDQHRRIHSQLLAEAAKLKDYFVAGKSSLGDLREFIANTVVSEHMLKTDRLFFSLFEHRSK